MLNQLRYKVTFKTPKKTLEGNLYFNEGMTGITGPNGNGKSFILEMVRFGLHGSEALRGKSDDYEVLDMELDFEIKNRALRVARSKTKATLKELVEGQVVDLASGTKAVNLKIEELFGYSSDVFRMANICEQGKIEQLGDLKPTERKRLVDETIGLSVLDEMNAFIDGKRKDLTTGIKAIESILVVPVEPQNPNLPYASVDYKAQVTTMRQERDRRNSFRDIASRPLVAPIPPEKVEDNHKLSSYYENQETRTATLTEYTVLDRELKAIPVYKGIIVDKLHDCDGQYDMLVERRRRAEQVQAEINADEKNLTKFPWHEPVIPLSDLDAMEERLKMLRRWEQKLALKQRNVPHDCPKCNHHWEDEDPRLKTEYADVPDERPDVPYNEAYLKTERQNTQLYLTWKPVQDRLEEKRKDLAALEPAATISLINEIEITRKQYQASQAERENQRRRSVLEKQLADLSAKFQALPDYAERIKVIDAYRTAAAQFVTKEEMYKQAMAEVEQAKKELSVYPEDLDQKLEEMEANYVLALNYETNLANYVKTKEAYDKAAEQCAGLKLDLEHWTNARQAVVDLRAKVKGYLLPSLNTVASLLIGQMTGGLLSIVNVNDDFEITVDGQRLETLSGAGKAVANLALRIGLGQVLCNRVFSVFMGDELDASMDDDRAAYVAQCLMNLTKTFKQVLLVSHKSKLVANHHIRL